MSVNLELSFLALFATLTSVYGGDYCFDRTGSLYWCAYGCCGYMQRDCCDANIALIVGLTVLAILVVSVVIAVVCCFMRRRGARGQVLSNVPPAGTSAMVVSSSTGHTTVTTMGQPVAYNTQAYQPGAYGPPAYPMGPQHPPPMGFNPAMAPPPYSQVTGQDNQAYKPPN